MKTKTLMLAIALGLVAVLGVASSQGNAAGPDCLVTYTVQRGDYLAEIAAQAGISVARLARINGIRNPNLIWPGQVLCIPGFEVETPTTFELVAEYTFNNADPSADPEASKTTLFRDGKAGVRLRYPLDLGDPIHIYTETVRLREISASSEPVLWLVRPSPLAPTYTLAVIGDPGPLLDLQMEMTPTTVISDIIPPPDPQLLAEGLCSTTPQGVSKVALSGKHQVVLRAEVIGAGGTFVPVPISKIDYHPTVEGATPCYPRTVAFALHRTADTEVTGYRLLMWLDDTSIGPPKYHQQNCRTWRGNGYTSRTRRDIYRCR